MRPGGRRGGARWGKMKAGMGGPQPSLCELTKKHSMTKSASSNYFSSLPLFFIADLLEFMCFYGRIVSEFLASQKGEPSSCVNRYQNYPVKCYIALA